MRLAFASVAQAKKNWRLRKTTARKLDFRPIEDDDVRYVWAAYKAESLNGAVPEGLDVEQFEDTFKKLIVSRYDAAWTMFAETKKGFVPVGLALGFWPHPQATPFLLLDAFTWFPWATPRNKIESAANFFSKMKREIPMIGFAKMQYKTFYDVMAKHGLLRRIGTSSNVFGGEPATVWETAGRKT